MSTYTYSQEETQKRIKSLKSMLWSVVVFFLIVMIGLSIVFYFVSAKKNIESDGLFNLLLALSTSITLILLTAYFTINSILKNTKPIKIEILNDRIIEDNPGHPKYYIMRFEIKNIVEIPDKGIYIQSLKSRDIFVPQNLIDYDKFKSELSSRHTINKASSNISSRRENITIMFVSFIIISFIFLPLIPINKDWEPVRITLLFTIYSFFVTALPLVTGRMSDTLTKEDEPFFYWLLLALMSSIPVVCFFFADYGKISATLHYLFEFRPEILLIVALILIIWAILIIYIIIKHREKQRILLSRREMK